MSEQTTGTATYMGTSRNGSGAEWRHYRLSPPVSVQKWDAPDECLHPGCDGEHLKEPVFNHHEYVIVSANNVPYSGPETYIFPADSEGDITSWGELPGSFRGALDHEEALRNAGYEVTP